MTLLARRLSRLPAATLVVGVALVAMLPAQLGILLARREPGHVRSPVVAAPATRPGVTSTRAPEQVGAESPFAGLGAWVDVYDYGLDPVLSVKQMRARGVRTLYLQTARFKDPFDVHPKAGAWLSAAHSAGLLVVGWYLPGYGDLARDLRRARALARPIAGERFDAAGIDIEFRAQVASLGEWNSRVARYSRAVRRALPRSLPVAAITPAPLGMATAPAYWRGFPWRALGAASDAIIVMDYWSYRKDCATKAAHCAFAYTKRNVERVRALTGRSDIPIHVAGGVADVITATEVGEFARAVRQVRAHGASLYDFRVTTPEMWAPMQRIFR